MSGEKNKGRRSHLWNKPGIWTIHDTKVCLKCGMAVTYVKQPRAGSRVFKIVMVLGCSPRFGGMPNCDPMPIQKKQLKLSGHYVKMVGR
jgi:hypothetical protein